MKYSISLVFALLIGSTSIAQQCENVLLGKIIDFHDNTPLADALVSVTGKSLRTSTKANGGFKLLGLCDGVVELEISHPECSTKFVTVSIEGDTYKQITLEHHLEELDAVSVTGSIIDATSSSQEAHLSQETVEKYGGNSLGDALKNIAGVATLNTGANIVKPVIQGLMGSRILILNNNVRMQDMEWGEEHAPNIDINANQNISVVKGASALEYGGDAIGGVILLNPLAVLRTDSLYGKTHTNLFSNGRGGNITSSLTKSYKSGLYLTAQGSLKRLGDTEAPDYVLSNTSIQEQGAAITLGQRDFKQGWEAYYSFFSADIGILRASHIGNIDDLIQAINSDTPNTTSNFSYDINRPSQEVTHHLGKLNYYRRFKGLGKWNVQYDIQQNNRLEFDIRVGEDANKASLDLSLTTHTLSTALQIDAKQGWHIKTGLLARYQDNFANPDTGVRRLIPDYTKQDFGAFVIADHNLTDRLTVDAGLRYDYTFIDAKKFYRTSRWEERQYQNDFGNRIISDLGTQLLVNPIFNFHNFSGTTGFNYDLNNQRQLRFNYSIAQRAPNPAELFSDGLHHSAARIELGDLRLASETASKLALELKQEQDTWGYTIAPYLRVINNFMILEPTGVEFTIRGAFPVWAYRQTNAQLLGVDISGYKNWSTHISTQHRFAWVQGTDTQTDIPLINMPPANLTNSIRYTKPRWNNFSLGLESAYVFEQTRFPPNLSVFSPEQQQELALNINTPPPAYHLIALEAASSFSLQQKNDFNISLRITNLANTAYRDYLNRQRYFVDDLGRNIHLSIRFNY